MDFVTLQPGDVINNRYELLDKLGAGAFGAVFRARQLGIDRIVAVKCLLQEAGAVDETAIERFKREARLSSALEHPNTITIHDYGQTESGVFYLVMEYVRGVTLKKLLRKEQRLAPLRALHITKQVLYSLHEAHSRGIVHRDMKPANIMLFNRLGEKDVIKVLDFGIAKFATAEGAQGSAKEDLTVAGRIIGTPRYMAPEQINGKGAFPASDLYALGLILYEMLAGKQAVVGDSTLTLIAQQISNTPIINANDPLIPPSLRPVMAKATNKNMLQRYQTATEFVEAIEALDADALAAFRPGESSGDRSLERGLTPTMSGEHRSVERPADDTADETRNERPVPGTLPPSAMADSSDQGGGMRWGVIAAVAILVVGLAAVGIGFGLSDDEQPAPNAALASANGATPGEDAGADEADPNAAAGDEEGGEPADDEASETPEPAADEEDEAPGEDEGDEAAPATREVTIASEPPGAEVKRDGESLGQTPLTLNLAPDEAPAFEVTLAGYRKEVVDIDATAAGEVKVALKNLPRPTANNNKRRRRGPRGNKGGGKGRGNKGGGKAGGDKGGGNKGGGNDYEVF